MADRKTKDKHLDVSGWDYRIVQTEQGHGIYEVFYDENGKVEGYSSFSLEGFTPQELKIECEEIQKAFSKPVLNSSEIEFNIWNKLLNVDNSTEW